MRESEEETDEKRDDQQGGIARKEGPRREERERKGLKDLIIVTFDLPGA